MATQLTSILRHIHQFVGPASGSDLRDAELLRRFVASRDEWAFRVLVGRHGGMVLNVCRQVLHHTQDAEDAFQATFLVLAQRADSIREGAALASWLYGIAHRTALRARLRASRRQLHEKRAGERARSRIELDAALWELQAVLAEEVNRLPEKYRAPFVLCCLEGKSRQEAAAQLGWKDGTLSGRLAEARRRLQGRLERRGLTLAAALCAGAVGAGVEAAVPPFLVGTTIKAALGIAAGQTVKGVASVPVATLAEGVIQTMFLSKVKLTGILLVAAGLVAAGAGLHFHRALAVPAGSESARAPAAQAAEKTPAAKKDDKVIVSGRVLDPDGKPFTGARVFLPGAVWGDSQKGSLVEVMSGEDGRFRFTIDRAQLVQGRSLAVTAKGYALDWIEADKLGRGDITLRLAKDAPIRGRVLDLEGRPIKGAVVKVESVRAAPGEDLTPAFKAWQQDADRGLAVLRKYLHQPGWAGIPAEVTTDADGRFRITGVGRERLAVLRVEGETIEHKSLYVFCRPGADVAALTKPDPKKRIPGAPRVSPPAVYGLTFEHPAQPCKPIVGVVKDRATGKPLAGIEVGGRAADHWWDYAQTKTDAEGRFRLVGVAKASHYHIRARGDAPYLPSKQQVSDSEGLKPLTVDFEVARGVLVRGRVTDQTTGKPVECSVDYFPLPDNEFFKDLRDKASFQPEPVGMVTGRDGTFRLPVLPGPGVIMVSVHGEAEGLYTEAVLDPAHKSRAADAGDFLGPSFVSASGNVQPLLGHQAYQLIEPPQGSDPITCDIALDRGRKVTGTVVGPDDKPLAGAVVYGLTAIVLGRPVSLKDASFTAQALNPARPRTVAFVHKERKLAGHVALRGDEKEPLRVKLGPWGAVTGRALDSEGNPLVDAECIVLHRSNQVHRLFEASREKIKTDQEGRFRVEGLFPGIPFDVSFVKKGTIHSPGNNYRKLSVKPGRTKGLGDITAKPFRPE